MSRLIEWESVCLVCLQKGENRYIFGEDNDSKVIADKIMKCSDILIKKDTNQPQNICLQCLDDLNVAYKFRRNCEQSFSIIKALINTNQRFEIKDLWKTTPITMNPTHAICIKDEITDNVVDTHGSTPCLDLKDDYHTETTFVEDRVDTCAYRNTMELNNMKVSDQNEPKQDMNCEISCQPSGLPKKSTEESYRKPSQMVDDDIGENALCLDFPKTESKPVHDIANNTCNKNTPSLNLEDNSGSESKVVQDRADACVESNVMESINVKADRSNNSRPEVNCEMSKQSRGRLKKSTKVACAKARLKSSSKNKPQKICKICGHSFRFQTPFDIHMRRHNNERPFSCDRCDKAFVTAPELQCHLRVHTGQKPFKCRHCDCRFSDYSVRQNHESTHTGERPYKCPTCGKGFAYSKGLTMHLRIHTGEKKFMCKKCNKGFTKKVHFVKHLARHPTSDHKQLNWLEKEIFQIEESTNSNEITIKHEIVEDALVNDNSDTTQQANCEVPKRSRIRPKSLKVCEICNHGFRDQSALDDHIRRHKNERPFTCDHCDKAFVRLPELRRHVRVHTGQKPYKCQYCDCRFSDYSVRQNHESTHTGERPYKCPICAKTFATYSKGLMRHLRLHNSEKKFGYKKCTKELTKKVFHESNHLTPNELDKSSIEKEIFEIKENVKSNEITLKHEIVENAVVNDNCNIHSTPCLDVEDGPVVDFKNYKFAQQPNGEIPKRRRGRPKKSMEVPPKVCEICNRNFKDQCNLDIHMRRHNNERPFSCDYCDKAFVRAAELRRHMRVHTGQKPYKCQYCDRRFSDCSSRKYHERSHTGERPYVCSTCGKSFTYSKGLTKHLLIHTGIKEEKRLEKETIQIEECGNSIKINMKQEEEAK